MELLTALLPTNKQNEGESEMQEKLVSTALESGPDKAKGSRSTTLWPTHTSTSGQPHGDAGLLLPVRTPFHNLPSLPATSSVLTLHRHPLQEQSPTGQSSAPFLQPRFQLCFSAPCPPSAGHGVNNSHGATPLCLHAENTGKNTTRQGRGA